MTAEFVIEKGIPLPSGKAATGLTAAILRMEPGDSLLILSAKPSASMATAHFAAKSHGRKVTVRKVEGGVRVWLVSTTRGATSG